MSIERQTYESDDLQLFCRHCGRAHWRHYYVSGLGFACEGPASDHDEFRTHDSTSAIND